MLFHGLPNLFFVVLALWAIRESKAVPARCAAYSLKVFVDPSGNSKAPSAKHSVAVML
jgi:hypothetical protein